MFQKFLSPAHIRTAVPAFVGAGLSWLIVHVSFAQTWFNSFDKLNPNWRGWLSMVVTGTTITVYYSVARFLGKKYPKIEKLLLGSSKIPSYNGK